LDCRQDGFLIRLSKNFTITEISCSMKATVWSKSSDGGGQDWMNYAPLPNRDSGLKRGHCSFAMSSTLLTM
jgi:hypothetical protein